MNRRPFLGARIEDRFNRWLDTQLSRRGWRQHVMCYTSFGTQEQVRILGRVVLLPHDETPVGAALDAVNRRGWRNFINAPSAHSRVTLELGETHHVVHTDRGGYIDVRVKNPGLAPGWHEVGVRTADGATGCGPVQVIDKDETFGIVSDIDDTVLSTFLPRPMIAAWNSLVVTEGARQAVPGMARLYQQLLAEHPGAPVVYVSTGAWGTYPMLKRFMKRHGLPQGAMLLTDWGPTNTGWFRSGPEHKRRCLRELARDLPHIQWVLVGDDGQHDPELYGEFATLQPQHVRARAIRQLSPGEHVLANAGLVSTSPLEWTPDTAPEVRGPDGDALADKLRPII